jgi:hypothetical protein
MTVGKLIRNMVLLPLIIAIFAYPIYSNIVEGVAIYSPPTFLHFITMLLSHILLCYTVCNWEEDLKSWWSWENLKYYMEEGKSNKYKNRGY